MSHDFPAWYKATRGRDPFPWMARLASQLRAGQWPDVLALPTGSGKTEIVAIWAHTLAMAGPGQVPRRLWLASDRRVIADRAEQVARELVQILNTDPIPPVVAGVAFRLQRLGGRLPLQVGLVRGGLVLDDEPLLDPVTPTVIATTVDQLGSRLLFRGYGASPRAWPIWAGLAGEDSLIVLDEAHLSAAAETTFRQVRRLGAGLRLVSMTATPRPQAGSIFTLDAKDRAHPGLKQRLEAQRGVELRQVDDVTAGLIAAAAGLQAQGAKRLAVVCNTVRRAREVFHAIQKPAGDIYLLIGRSRPLDRQRLMDELEPRIRSGAKASPPLVVVTTQCIETGADFDFDGMVSEACPLDALRQRLGRLDRLGRQGASRCILIAPAMLDDAPPYGAAARLAFDWLRKVAGHDAVDLGITGWEQLAAKATPPAEASTPQAPGVSLLEPHLRLLVQTAPRPAVEPAIGLLLHGRDRSPGDISLIWRDDIQTDDPAAASEILALVPPTALEALAVPVWELRRWLQREDMGEVADLEGSVHQDEPARAKDRAWVLRWLGRDAGVERCQAGALQPGDVVVLPSALGGCDRFGWAPGDPTPVKDLGDQAWSQKTGNTIRRIPLAEDEELAELRRHAAGHGQRIRCWSGGIVVEQRITRRSLFAEREVPLAEHACHVEARVRADAKALGLDAQLMAMAARWHDAGKADERWQLLVRDGDPCRDPSVPLAKGRVTNGRRAALWAGLPTGWRHEAESVRRLHAHAGQEGSEVPDLVTWLVATHHGHARPWWPPMEGEAPWPCLATLMRRLGRQHGWWRLALHEAVLRCADRAVSRQEQEELADDWRCRASSRTASWTGSPPWAPCAP